jgi:hypothetical protein
MVWLPTGVEFEAVARNRARAKGSCRIVQCIHRIGERGHFRVQLSQRGTLSLQDLLLGLPDLLGSPQVRDQLIDRRSYVNSLPCAQGGTQRVQD